MKAIGQISSEELRSQSIMILKMHEQIKSPITPIKIIESKLRDTNDNLQIMTNHQTKYE